MIKKYIDSNDDDSSKKNVDKYIYKVLVCK